MKIKFYKHNPISGKNIFIAGIQSSSAQVAIAELRFMYPEITKFTFKVSK